MASRHTENAEMMAAIENAEEKTDTQLLLEALGNIHTSLATIIEQNGKNNKALRGLFYKASIGETQVMTLEEYCASVRRASPE